MGTRLFTRAIPWLPRCPLPERAGSAFPRLSSTSSLAANDPPRPPTAPASPTTAQSTPSSHSPSPSPATSISTSSPTSPPTPPPPRKTLAELDAEALERFEAKFGGAEQVLLGVLIDGKPEGLARAVKNNMFRVIGNA